MSKPNPTWQPLRIPSAQPMPQTAATNIAIATPPPVRSAPERILFTKAEAAEALGISSSVLDRLIRTGQLRVVRFEQRIVRIRPVDLHAFAERHLVGVDEATDADV